MMKRGEPQEFIRAAVLYEGDKCLIWPFGKSGNGYGALKWEGATRRAHRIVCRLKHGEPTAGKNDAAHHCGNPSCVNPNHIRWATSAENAADRVKHGTAARGERGGLAKLTESDVFDICARLEAGEIQREIAVDFPIAEPTVNSINLGRSWGWLTGRKKIAARG